MNWLYWRKRSEEKKEMSFLFGFWFWEVKFELNDWRILRLIHS